MSRHTNPGAAPAPQPREPYTAPCKRSCCWTPYGHRPTAGCACHTPEDPTRRQRALQQLDLLGVGVEELEALARLAAAGVRAPEIDTLRTLWEGGWTS